MARMMVEEEIEWLDGMINGVVTEDESLRNKCCDIAKGRYN
jgi:hypothetical protein